VSGTAVLDGLFGSSRECGADAAPLVELYTRRLLELQRDPVYRFLRESNGPLLACLPRPAQKAHFVLALWQIAPPEDWGGWGVAMPNSYSGAEFAAEAGAVAAQMLATAPSLEPEAARSVREHLPPLGRALAKLEESSQLDLLAGTAQSALGDRAWWTDSQPDSLQGALHDVIRALEVATPAAAEPLRRVRSADVTRCPLEDPEQLSAMLGLAADLDPNAYPEIEEALPDPDSEQRPVFYAESVVARVVIQVRDPQRAGGTQIVAGHLRRLKRLRELNFSEYRQQRRAAAIGCLDLRPTAAQLGALSDHIGSQLGAEGSAALGRWAERANKRDRADALVRLIRPLFSAGEWAVVLSEYEFVEAPVVRELAKELRKDGSKVEDRRRMAGIVRGLRLRTQSARNEVADLIVALLGSKPKTNLSVALILAEGLGPEHQREVKLKRALERYARKRSYKFTPPEVQAIGALGIEVSGKYLSRGAVKRAGELAAQGLEGAKSRLRGLLGGDD
jgi:hypothetical protein